MRLQREDTHRRAVQQAAAAGGFNSGSNSPSQPQSYASALPAGMRRRAPTSPSAANEGSGDERESIQSHESVHSVLSDEDLSPEELEAKKAREARLAALGSVDDALLATGLQNLQVDSASKGKRQTIARTKETEETIISNVLQVIKDSQAGE